MDKQIHVICLLLLDNSLYWKWGIIRTNIRTNIGPANTNIRGDLWTANANANISKCCEYVFVPTPNYGPCNTPLMALEQAVKFFAGYCKTWRFIKV